jgi:hypothetical protein
MIKLNYFRNFFTTIHDHDTKSYTTAAVYDILYIVFCYLITVYCNIAYRKVLTTKTQYRRVVSEIIRNHHDNLLEISIGKDYKIN